MGIWKRKNKKLDTGPVDPLGLDAEPEQPDRAGGTERAGPPGRRRHMSRREQKVVRVEELRRALNEAGEDIGARRLHAVFEELLEDISFNAGGDEMPDVYLNITADYVREHLGDIMQTNDMHRYIL